MRNSLLHSQKIYDPNDSALLSEQEHCMGCLYDYNATRPSEKRTQLLHTMLAECGKGCWIEPPFHANWGGRHLHLGNNVYANFGLTCVDDTHIYIGNHMKPLNALPKFENHFANQTVRFQVQLGADGYFFFRKFLSLQPPQAGRVGTNLQFLNLILQIQLQNTCWASPKPDVQHKNALASHLNDR